jgi:hypothetical protein
LRERIGWRGQSFQTGDVYCVERCFEAGCLKFEALLSGEEVVLRVFVFFRVLRKQSEGGQKSPQQKWEESTHDIARIKQFIIKVDSLLV